MHEAFPLYFANIPLHDTPYIETFIACQGRRFKGNRMWNFEATATPREVQSKVVDGGIEKTHPFFEAIKTALAGPGKDAS
jgi:hypothetical protein